MWPGIVLGVFALGVISVEFWRDADRKLKRRMRKLPRAARIADTPLSQDTRVTGTLAYVDGSTPLIAPFSKRPCVAWRIVVERGDHKRWREIHRSDASIDFVLRDKSGRATVDSVNLALALDTDAEAHKHIIGRSTPGFVEFCGSLNIDTWGQSLRMREGILELGEVVTVGGRCRLEHDVNSKVGYRGQSAMLRVGPLESGETLASDDSEFPKVL